MKARRCNLYAHLHRLTASMILMVSQLCLLEASRCVDLSSFDNIRDHPTYQYQQAYSPSLGDTGSTLSQNRSLQTASGASGQTYVYYGFVSTLLHRSMEPISRSDSFTIANQCLEILFRHHLVPIYIDMKPTYLVDCTNCMCHFLSLLIQFLYLCS